MSIKISTEWARPRSERCSKMESADWIKIIGECVNQYMGEPYIVDVVFHIRLYTIHCFNSMHWFEVRSRKRRKGTRVIIFISLHYQVVFVCSIFVIIMSY